MIDKRTPPFDLYDKLDFRWWQLNMHPYTCMNDNCPTEQASLEIDDNRLFCPNCDYEQYWMHQA